MQSAEGRSGDHLTLLYEYNHLLSVISLSFSSERSDLGVHYVSQSMCALSTELLRARPKDVPALPQFKKLQELLPSRTQVIQDTIQ